MIDTPAHGSTASAPISALGTSAPVAPSDRGRLDLREAFGSVRFTPELVTARRLLARARANPYWRRSLFAARGFNARRLVAWAFGATLAFVFGTGLALSAGSFSPWKALVVGYLPLRLFLIFRAARATATASGREIRPGNLEHLHQTLLRPRDLVLGWSLLGWGRALAEASLVFAFVAPWFMRFGVPWTVLLAVEVLHVAVLQAMAAVVSAERTYDFDWRREASSAGSVLGSFSFPIVFAFQSLVLSLFLFFVFGFALSFPLTAFLLLAASDSAPVDVESMFGLLEIVGFVAFAGYAIWLPLGAVREIERRLGRDVLTREKLARYLERKVSARPSHG